MSGEHERRRPSLDAETAASGVSTRARAGSGAASTCCRACSRWRTCSAATPASSIRCAASSTAAPFIGFAIVLDMLDGRIARMTGTTSAFGLEFDSLADVVSFGVAPAILSFPWGLATARPDRMGGRLPVRRRGRASAGALQHPVGIAGQALLRRHAQSGGGLRPGGDRVRLSAGIQSATHAVAVLAMVIVPALPMVSTIRFRSFKTFDLQTRRSSAVLVLVAAGSWCCSRPNRSTCWSPWPTPIWPPFIGYAWTRFRHRRRAVTAGEHEEDSG